MATYFMFGKYSPESVRDIAVERTREAVGIVEDHEGQISAMFALLGPYDLVLIVNLPGNTEAMHASIELSRATGITFTTAPAISIEKFDQMIRSEPDEEDFLTEEPEP